MIKQSIKVKLHNVPILTNDAYLHLYKDKHRYMVLYGGAGSGKSVFAAQKLIARMLSEDGHKFLVVRKVGKTMRESTYSLLVSIINQWGMANLFTCHRGDMRITCNINGNQIIHAGLDDPEKIKSIANITGIWVEEASEFLQEDIQQLDLRLRGHTAYYKQIILSFNPIDISHWLKTIFFDNPKEDSIVLHTTYKDNRFLDQQYINVLLDLKDADPYYYSVYALGEWGVLGQTVYPARIVTERLIYLKDKYRISPPTVGRLMYDIDPVTERIRDDSIRFVADPKGNLTIYEEPKTGFPYVIGGDIAEGGLDNSVGMVRNNISWNQAAVWRDHTDTDLYAKDMYALGRFYSKGPDCLIGIETNFDTHPVKELERLGYRKQYQRETMDTFTNQIQKKNGFVTTKITRPIIIGNHVALAREHIDTFNDLKQLEEMLVFIRDEKGKPQAAEGKHDDMILADAICGGIRDQQTTELPKIQRNLSNKYYTESELQDMGLSKSEIRKLMAEMKSYKVG